MKPFSTSIFLYCFLQFSFLLSAQTLEELATKKALFIIEENGKYGLMEENGKVWLKPKFDGVLYLDEGQAISKASYLNHLINPYTTIFREENFLPRFFSHTDTLPSFICVPKRHASPDFLAHVIPYNTGQILVKEGKKCYYLDKNAQPLLSDYYEDATLFRDGIAAVKKDGKVGIIDSTGQWTILPKYWDIMGFSRDFLIAKERFGRFEHIPLSSKRKPSTFLNSHIYYFKGTNRKIGLKDMNTQQVLVPPIYIEARSSQKGTALVLQDNDWWILIDTTGRQISDERYEVVKYFQEGFAGVYRNCRWSFINSKGETLGGNQFSHIIEEGFHNGLAMVKGNYCYTDSVDSLGTKGCNKKTNPKVRCEKKQALIDTTGKIRLVFDQIGNDKYGERWYESPYVRVRNDGMSGIVHRDSLQVLIPPIYEGMHFLPHHGYHFVKLPKDSQNRNNLWGIIDLQGKEMIAPQFEGIKSTLNPNQILVKKNEKWGVISPNGNVVIPAMYEKISPQKDIPYYLFWENEKTGLLDSLGKVVIDAKHNYDEMEFDFVRQIIKVQKNKKWGYIDFQQNTLLSLEYDELGFLFPPSLGVLTMGKKDRNQTTYFGLGYFNKKTGKLEKLLPPLYHHITHIKDEVLRLDKIDKRFFYHIPSRQLLNQAPFDKTPLYNIPYGSGTISFHQNNQWGVIDTLGNTLIPAKYLTTTPFQKDFSKVTLQSANLLIDTLGEVIDTISGIFFFAKKSPLKRFQKNGKEGLLNPSTGEIILSAQFDKIQSEKIEKYECDFVCAHQLTHVYKDGKMGLIDIEGNEILAPVYTVIKEQSLRYQTVWLVEKDGKKGLTNEKGEFLLETKYTELQHYKNNQYLYRQKKKYGFIRIPDEDFEKSIAEFNVSPKDMPSYIPPIFEDVYIQHNTRTVFAKQKRKWGVLNTNGPGITGKMKIEAQFDTFKVYKPRTDYFIAVKKKRKWGVYKSSNWLIKEIVCDEAPEIFDYYFEVVEKGMKSRIDFYGNTLPKEFEEIKHLSSRYSLFKKGEKWGIFRNGNTTQKPQIIYPAEFEGLGISFINNRWFPIKKEGINGFFDTSTGKLILEKNYGFPTQINNKYIGLQKNRKWSIYDSEQEKIVADTPYKKITPTKTDALAVGLGDKWGLFSLQTMKELIPPQFKSIDTKDKNATNQWIVTLQKDKERFYGVIDHTGKIIIEPNVKQRFERKKDGTYNISQNEEDLIIDRKPYTRKHGYKGNLALVHFPKTKKWGFVNKEDSLVIPAIFDKVRTHSLYSFCKDCLFLVEKEGQKGTIDSLGNIQFPPKPYEAMYQFSPNCYRVRYKGKSGLIDSLGNKITSIQYEDFRYASETILSFQKGDKWGYMDYFGKVIAQAQFSNPESFHNGLTTVHRDRKEGVINEQSHAIIPVIYSRIDNIHIQDTLFFKLLSNTGQGLADTKGKIIIPPIYESLQTKIYNQNPIFEKNGWIKCLLNDGVHYFNTKGEKVLTSMYPETQLISKTLAVVKDTKTNKWGLRNLQTKKWILKPIYDEFKSEGGAIKSFTINSKMAYVNRKGKYVWKEKGFELLE